MISGLSKIDTSTTEGNYEALALVLISISVMIVFLCLVGLTLLIPNISLLVRRLHDIGKSGKLTINGLKAGQKVSYYKNKKGIHYEDFLVGNKPGYDSVRSPNALAFTNFQENVPFMKRTITQVNADNIKAVSRKKIHQVYGKPLSMDYHVFKRICLEKSIAHKKHHI